MVKILNCYFYAKKSYGTVFKGAIFFGQPCIILTMRAPLFKFLPPIKTYNLGETKGFCPNNCYLRPFL